MYCSPRTTRPSRSRWPALCAGKATGVPRIHRARKRQPDKPPTDEPGKESALRNLGYKGAEVDRRLDWALGQLGADTTLEELLKRALAYDKDR